MTYSVKNVKTFMGNKGYGFNASLYEDGKRVALVIDDAWGGCLQFQWSDKDVEKRIAAEKRLQDYTASTGGIYIYINDGGFHRSSTYVPCADDIVNNLVNEYLDAKDMRKALKARIVYSDGEKLYQTSTKVKPTKDNIEKIKNVSWWKDSYMILNTMSEQTALKWWKAAA